MPRRMRAISRFVRWRDWGPGKIPVLCTVLLYLGLAHALREEPGRAVEVWRGYFNVDRPLIQRAVNLQIALYDSGVATSAREMAESVLEAIREQERNE